MSLRKLLVITMASALLLTGCTKNTPTTAIPTPSPSASPSNPYGAAPIDPPGPNDVVLTLTNGAKTKEFTMKQLAALGTSDVSLYEPFVKMRQTFTVIHMVKLFNLVNMKPEDTLVTRALNDYVFTEKVKKFESADALLAIKRDGADIPFDQGGPIRIVFADTSSWATFLDAWNWSLSSLSIG